MRNNKTPKKLRQSYQSDRTTRTYLRGVSVDDLIKYSDRVNENRTLLRNRKKLQDQV